MYEVDWKNQQKQKQEDIKEHTVFIGDIQRAVSIVLVGE